MRADFVFTCTAAQAPFAMAIARNASSMFLGEDQTKKNPPLGAKAAVVSKTIPGELGRVLVRVMPEFGLDPQTKTASKDPDCVNLDLAIAFDRKGRPCVGVLTDEAFFEAELSVILSAEVEEKIHPILESGDRIDSVWMGCTARRSSRQARQS